MKVNHLYKGGLNFFLRLTIVGGESFKVHESTLRKRLNEFGQTSASQLTLEEFLAAEKDGGDDLH